MAMSPTDTPAWSASSPPYDARSTATASASRTSSIVSTPASASSPQSGPSTPGAHPAGNPAQRAIIRPSAAPPPAHKMSMSSVMSPSPVPDTPKMTMTTKEWVIPPRPKPGRKPATDTPPTKRKAQNRAAQRAFRERRAARVGELEDLLDDQKEEQDKVEKDLKDRIHSLEMQLESFKSRCAVLENLLERERSDRVKAETKAEGLKRRWNDGSSTADGVPRRSLPDAQHTPRRDTNISAAQPFSISHIVASPKTADLGASAADFSCGSCGPDGSCPCADEVLANSFTGCGNCSLGSACECLEATIKSVGGMPDLKRPSSTTPLGPGEKRHRPEPHAVEATEIDFTAMFSRKAAQPNVVLMQPQPQMASMPLKDGCGFCKDGTYCVCADMALSANAAAYPQPSAYSQQTRTPPPSENDAVPQEHRPMEVTETGAVKLRPRQNVTLPRPTPRGCGPNGPGSCGQCLSDPKSGLFCRSLAANFERQGGVPGGCCGGGTPGGGCCKSPGKPAAKNGLGLSLSCAEAYQTLSSHQNFDKAADDIGSWLPKLKAAPIPGEAPVSPSRLPIEVEAASIMSVLKDFDIRFGRGL